MLHLKIYQLISWTLIWIMVSSCESTPSNNKAAKQQNSTLPYAYSSHGVEFSPTSNPSSRIRIQVRAANILRVTSAPSSTLPKIESLMIQQPLQSNYFQHRVDNGILLVTTKALTAEVNLENGALRVRDKQGHVFWETTDAGHFRQVKEDPAPPQLDRYAVSQTFKKSAQEGFYGLGLQQNGKVNYAATPVTLTTHNLEIAVPYLVSSNHYGILWDNNGISRFGTDSPDKPLFEGFDLYDAAGIPGGLTAYYYDGNKLLTSRVERDTNYQYLTQGNHKQYPFPKEALEAKELRVELHGSLAAKTTGKYYLRAYSSGYLKMYLNNKLVLDRWRMNWNPWYHNLESNFTVGERTPIKIYWTPDGGYFRLLHQPPEQSANHGLLSAETAKAIDYYIVKGNNTDEVISGYRQLTGKANLLPKWAFGFWQSRERYQNQDQLLTTLQTYREQKIPIDNIVLDWFYWPENAWGSHKFDHSNFPSPKKMVDKVHRMNAQIMISVWPKFYPTTSHYQDFANQNWLFNQNVQEKNLDWVGPGYLNAFYDAFSEEAGQLYWQQLNESLAHYGFDAWWLDATEPDMHSNLSETKRKDFMTPNALGTGAEVFNAYALPHTTAVSEGLLKRNKDTRPFILSRSGFAGIQRNNTAVWSGDIVSRWSNLKEQISAGIGLSLSGVPYWTFDIGGFTPENRFRQNAAGDTVTSWKNMDPSQLEEWQELNARWFQLGAFAPLFRAHGQNPFREIFHIAKPRSQIYKNLVKHTHLRYRLMPYLYSVAAETYHNDGTIVRGLIMDFPEDPNVKSIDDQFMFGPSIMVAPITELGARSREIYLPEGSDWIDIHSGESFSGGQTLFIRAPLDQIPLFAKAGAVILTGPEIQHVFDQPNAALTINLFFGANGQIDLYEDDGKSLDYQSGGWSRIPIVFDQKKKLLTIGQRIGTYNEQQATRSFRLRWIKGKGDLFTEFDHPADAEIIYKGEEISIQL